MKAILSHPALYQAYQNAGGFFGARVKAIADYLALRPGMRVIDIGCGPGHILRHLPDGIEYTGFDIDEAYIAYARRSFGHLGTFHCRHFDAAAACERVPVADLTLAFRYLFAAAAVLMFAAFGLLLVMEELPLRGPATAASAMAE